MSLNIFGSNLVKQTSRKHCKHWKALSKRASPCELFTSSRISVAICRQTSGNDGEPCSIKNLKSSMGVNVPTFRMAAFFFAAAWASNELESFVADADSPEGSSTFPFSSRRAFFETLKNEELGWELATDWFRPVTYLSYRRGRHQWWFSVADRYRAERIFHEVGRAFVSLWPLAIGWSRRSFPRPYWTVKEARPVWQRAEQWTEKRRLLISQEQEEEKNECNQLETCVGRMDWTRAPDGMLLHHYAEKVNNRMSGGSSCSLPSIGMC